MQHRAGSWSKDLALNEWHWQLLRESEVASALNCVRCDLKSLQSDRFSQKKKKKILLSILGSKLFPQTDNKKHQICEQKCNTDTFLCDWSLNFWRLISFCLFPLVRQRSTAVREAIYISGLFTPLASWVFFFSLLLFLFVRFQHTLTMLYDLGLWKLSRGHCDIPDNAGATGATRLPRRESSKWNVCFKDMTCFTRPQKQSRHSGFVPRLLLTRLRQNNSLWFCFFEKYGADLVCAAQRRINSYKAGQAEYTTDLQYDAKMNVVFLHCVLI